MNQAIILTTNSSDITLLIIGIFLLLCFLCIRMIIVLNKPRKAMDKQRKQLIAQYNPSLVDTFDHVNGLPIAENTFCQVLSCPDQYVFFANGVTFNLEKSKVTDLCITSDVDIHKQYVSSVGGAIGGAIAFGPVGAAIGGRAKIKTTRESSYYLIFTYVTCNIIKYVGFDVTYSYLRAEKYVKEFKSNQISNTVNVNL